jgi:translation initiation factor IF-3
MDYGKFRFDNQKKAHAAKKKQKQTQVKEIKFRPNTEEADYQVKLKSITKFLNGGDKAKITMRFRGREIAHQVIGREVLDRVQKD